LKLGDGEVGALLNSVVGRGGSPSRVSVHFEHETFAAQASIALPGRIAAGKFLNVQVAGRLAIEQGHLELDVERLRVGRVPIPRLVLRILSSALHATLLDDPQIRRIVSAIDGLRMEAGAVRFEFQNGAISRQIVPSLVQLLWERRAARECRAVCSPDTGRLQAGARAVGRARPCAREPGGDLRPGDPAGSSGS
jgi:hypothetical protein